MDTLPGGTPVKIKEEDGTFTKGTIYGPSDIPDLIHVRNSHNEQIINAKLTDVFPIGNRALLKRHIECINKHLSDEKDRIETKFASNEKLLADIEKYETDEDELLALTARIKRMKNPDNTIKVVREWGIFHIDLDTFIKDYFVNE